jgi:hypothetical protein
MADTTVTSRGYLTNGVSIGTVYTMTANDLINSSNLTLTTPGAANVYEVITLTVTAGANAAGNISISLRGGAAVTVAVLGTDTTTGAVATKIRAGGVPTGYGITGAGNDIIYTATAYGAKTGAVNVSPAATNVAITTTFTTPGSVATAEVWTLNLANNAVATVNAPTLVVRGVANSGTAINITSGNTPTIVGTAIRAGTFTGWTTSGSAGQVIFTAGATGVKTGDTYFNPGNSGVITKSGILFNFNTNNNVNYHLVAKVVLRTSTGSVYNVTTEGLELDYSLNGKIKVMRGTIGATPWVAGSFLDIVAQRSV